MLLFGVLQPIFFRDKSSHFTDSPRCTRPVYGRVKQQNTFFSDYTTRRLVQVVEGHHVVSASFGRSRFRKGKDSTAKGSVSVTSSVVVGVSSSNLLWGRARTWPLVPIVITAEDVGGDPDELGVWQVYFARRRHEFRWSCFVLALFLVLALRL